MSQSMMPVSSQRARKNRLLILAGAAIVLLFALAFAHLTMTAISIRKQTSNVFMQWVIDQHLGSAQLVSDASGFNNDFCVLTLNQPIPGSQVQAKSYQYMHEYYELDGGTSLTIQYKDAATGKAVQESTVAYDDGSKTLFITLHEGPMAGRVVHKTVNWPNHPSSS